MFSKVCTLEALEAHEALEALLAPHFIFWNLTGLWITYPWFLRSS
jgi:hypothetical protein